MPRRLSLLLGVVGLAAAVLVADWLHHNSRREQTRLPVAQIPTVWPGEPARETIDPAAAVATILELREQFGSVLDNSELDLPRPNGEQSRPADHHESFDDFLRVAAGVASPADDDLEPSEMHEATTSTQSELLQSIGKTATLLAEHARQAKEMGHAIKERRLFALATLLEAEAAELTQAAHSQR